MLLKLLLGIALMVLSCVYAVRAQDDTVPGFWTFHRMYRTHVLGTDMKYLVLLLGLLLVTGCRPAEDNIRIVGGESDRYVQMPGAYAPREVLRDTILKVVCYKPNGFDNLDIAISCVHYGK